MGNGTEYIGSEKFSPAKEIGESNTTIYGEGPAMSVSIQRETIGMDPNLIINTVKQGE